jgi:hypothetical protein
MLRMFDVVFVTEVSIQNACGSSVHFGTDLTFVSLAVSELKRVTDMWCSTNV